jgi:hypothetical protein
MKIGYQTLKATHQARARALITLNTQLISAAKQSMHAHAHIVFDYMSTKSLPHPTPLLAKDAFASWKGLFGYGGFKRISLRCGGLYDAWSGLSFYSFHTHYTETSNSILTWLYLYITKIVVSEKRPVKHLSLTLDGMSLFCFLSLSLSLSLFSPKFPLLFIV